MNKEYIKLDNGKAIVIDELGNKKIKDMYNNFDDVLAHENVIMSINNSINSKKEKIKKLRNKKILLRCIAIISIVIHLVLGFSFGFVIGFSQSNIIKLIGLLLILFTFISNSDINLKIHNKILTNTKELSAYKKELEYLNDNLIKQKNIINNLKNNKTINKNNDKIYNEVKKLDELKLLKRRLRILHELEFNKEIYIKSMKKGKFDSVYNNNFIDSNELDFAKKYVMKMYNKKSI